jgi:O-methyltransferase/aklanonic acid methyltransferase
VEDDDVVAAAVAVFGRTAPTYDTVIPFFATFGRRLVEMAGVAKDDAVLDVACGRGASLLPAAERTGPTGRVLGVDLSEEMLGALGADLEGSGLDHAHVRRMDARALDVPEQSFDVVLCGFLLHMVPAPQQALRGFWRVLRVGGRCALSVPIGAGTEWDFFGELLRDFAPRAARRLPPPPEPAPDLAAMLREAGFAQVQQVEEAASFVFDGPEAWWAWVWTQGMRAFLEALPEDALADFRAAAFDRLAARHTHDGAAIELHQRARFATGRRVA